MRQSGEPAVENRWHTCASATVGCAASFEGLPGSLATGAALLAGAFGSVTDSMGACAAVGGSGEGDSSGLLGRLMTIAPSAASTRTATRAIVNELDRVI